MAILAVLAAPTHAVDAVDASFDRSMLSGAGHRTDDLSRFEHGNPVLPGNYNIDIYLNNTWVTRHDVRFAASAGQASASACIGSGPARATRAAGRPA